MQLVGDPVRELVAGTARVVDGRIIERHERHDVNHSESWVNTVVRMNREQLDSRARETARSVLTHECEHTAMVMSIGVTVEQIVTAGDLESGQDLAVAALAHVHHAFEHGVTLPGRARARSDRAGWETVRAPRKPSAGAVLA